MSREDLIAKTIKSIQQLPDEKVSEVADFVDFIFHKINDQLLNEGIENLTKNSKSYKFLEDEPNLYTVTDIKETYGNR